MHSAIGALMALAFIGCGSSSNSLDASIGPVFRLEVVSGSSQHGTVGEELPLPVVVHAVDANNHDVKQQVINFRVLSGGGSVFAGVAITNEHGIAQERWTLGTDTASPQVLEARAVENETGEALVFARFECSALPAPASRIIVDGGGQSGVVGSDLASSVTVLVQDRFGNPVPDVVVSARPEPGSGSVVISSLTTGPDGRASVTWRLGETPGKHTLVLAIPDGTSTTIFALANPARAASLDFESSPAGAVAGSALSPWPRLILRDRFGNIATGSNTDVTLVIAAGPQGALLLGSATQPAIEGIAEFQDLRIAQAGTSYVLGAEAMGLLSARSPPFDITAAAADPLQSTLNVAPASLEAGGEAVITAHVRDSFGNSVPGEVLTFEASGQNNLIFNPLLPTDRAGMASGRLLSTKAESKSVLARLSSGEALAGLATLVFVPGPAASGPGATYIAASPSVGDDDGTPVHLDTVVRDRFGNAVPAVDITFHASGPITFEQPSEPTDSTGAVTGTLHAFAPGSYIVTALQGAAALASTTLEVQEALPDLNRSDITVSPTSVPADGLTPVTVAITVRDSLGRPRAGRQLRLLYPSEATALPPSGSTDELGELRFSLTSNLPTTGTVAALVSSRLGDLPLASRPQVAFTRTTFGLGGSVSGLNVPGLILSTTGLADLPVPAGARTFAFDGVLATGAVYDVSIRSQPTGVDCSIANGSGTVGESDVSNIVVACSAQWRHAWAFGTHVVAIRADGTLWSWGQNASGQLGVGTTTQSETRPSQVGNDTRWISAATGMSHTVALNSAGELWAWGDNTNGALGDGTTISHSSPVRIGSDSDWMHVAAGRSFTLAVKTDGTLWSWGDNHQGALGSGDNVSRSSPGRVGADSAWLNVSAGFDHATAYRSDGTIWAWGNNQYGSVGDGSVNSPILAPKQVGNDNRWQSVDSGAAHNLALKGDGTLWGWGLNHVGQLGDGTTTWLRSPPVRLGTASNWLRVFAGDTHSLAIKSDGSMWGWGYNFHGEVGDGTMTQRLTPVGIGVGQQWSTAAPGISFTVAIRQDGTLWSWGENLYGQLGDGTVSERWTPTQVPNPP